MREWWWALAVKCALTYRARNLEPDDRVSVAALAAWKADRDYDPNSGRARHTWVYLKVRYALSEADRRAGLRGYRRPRQPPPQPGPDVVDWDEDEYEPGGSDPRMEGLPLRLWLEREMQMLDPLRRLVLRRRYVEGWSDQEQAVALGCSLNTLRNLIYTGKRKLRRRWGEIAVEDLRGAD